MENNVPADAVSIYFEADNGKKGTYHVWHRKGRYFWVGMGGSGEEEDALDATAAARRWIRDGIGSLKRSRS